MGVGTDLPPLIDYGEINNLFFQRLCPLSSSASLSSSSSSSSSSSTDPVDGTISTTPTANDNNKNKNNTSYLDCLKCMFRAIDAEVSSMVWSFDMGDNLDNNNKKNQALLGFQAEEMDLHLVHQKQLWSTFHKSLEITLIEASKGLML